MFWLRNKKIKFSLHTLNLSTVHGCSCNIEVINKSGKTIICDAVLNILSLFLIQYNEFDNTTVEPKPDMHKHN